MKLAGKVGGLIRETFLAWSKGKTPRLGAALAYYTVFAIAPLFLIALTLAGFLFGEEAARRELFAQLSSLLGKEGGEAVEAIVAAAGKKPDTGFWAGLAAFATLFIGATGVFMELQDALNTIWHVKRKAERGWMRFIKDRLLSFGMVLGIGFLLLVSLVLNAALSAAGRLLGGLIPGWEVFWQVTNFILSLGVVTVLFAMMFKILPDVRISWHDVWLGAFITAVLFNIGKFLLGFYLGKSSMASAYGAAGSLVIVLVWVYYSTQIVFLGAEFTRVYADHCGSRFTPVRGAQFVTIKEIKANQRKAA